MLKHLRDFREKLCSLEGSLVRVKSVKRIESNAKEYLNRLSQEGLIERVKWGWYWIPAEVKDFWDFLEKDENFKVISAQTAASFWNNDFVHRDVYVLKVKDKSYGEALKEFAKKRGWKVEVEYSRDPSKIRYRKIGNLFVEDVEENVVECLQRWAFVDAFATLIVNRDRISLERLCRDSYWKRVSKTDVRVKQALEYGFRRMGELGVTGFPERRAVLGDEFVRRDVDEAVERVVELG